MHELRWHLEEASAAAAARRGLCEGRGPLSEHRLPVMSSFIQTSMNMLRLQCCRNAHCLSGLSIIISNSTIVSGCRCQVIIFKNAKNIIKRINGFTSHPSSERYFLSEAPNANVFTLFGGADETR